jgi:hypothetical protein
MMRMQMSDRSAAERAQHKLGSTAESCSVVWVQPAYSHHKVALSYFRIDHDWRTEPGLAEGYQAAVVIVNDYLAGLRRFRA